MIDLTSIRSSACAALAFAALLGCGSSNPSALVDEPTQIPLPPASGTPIGVLIDESAKLSLRAEQLDKLHEIDRQLSDRTEQIEARLRDLDEPPPAAKRAGPGRNGPRGPKKSGPPSGSVIRGHHAGPDGAHRPGTDSPQRTSLIEERASATRDAVDQALHALDPAQRELAEQILDAHGAGETTARESPGEPAPRDINAPSPVEQPDS